MRNSKSFQQAEGVLTATAIDARAVEDTSTSHEVRARTHVNLGCRGNASELKSVITSSSVQGHHEDWATGDSSEAKVSSAPAAMTPLSAVTTRAPSATVSAPSPPRLRYQTQAWQHQVLETVTPAPPRIVDWSKYRLQSSGCRYQPDHRFRLTGTLKWNWVAVSTTPDSGPSQRSGCSRVSPALSCT